MSNGGSCVPRVECVIVLFSNYRYFIHFRYRKICVPFGRQVSRTTAKFLCLLVLSLACCMSWPAPILYGHSTVYITEHNITGSQCGNIDSLKDTKYMAFFNVGLVLIFIIVFVTLVVLYFLIWRVVMKHKPLAERTAGPVKDAPSTQTTDSHEKQHTPSSENTSNTTQFSTIANGDASNLSHGLQAVSSSTNLQTHSSVTKLGDVDSENISSGPEKPKKMVATHSEKLAPQKKPVKKFDAARRTTFIFTMIATLMFVSYVPHLIMKIIMFLNKDLVPSLSYTGRVFYKTFIWCFFINNMANPFVYGFYDKQFMTQVRALYGKIPAILKRKENR